MSQLLACLTREAHGLSIALTVTDEPSVAWALLVAALGFAGLAILVLYGRGKVR